MFSRSISRSAFIESHRISTTRIRPNSLVSPLRHVLALTPLNARSFSKIHSLTRPCTSSVQSNRQKLPFRSHSTTARAPKPLSIILTIVCPDRSGIVHSVTGWLASQGFNIRESAQYSDPATSRFFMRVHADAEGTTAAPDLAALRTHFNEELGSRMNMSFELTNEATKPRTMIMVSKIGHCIHDLLYRVSTGTLPIEVPLVVSNHPTFEKLCKSYDIPFYHLPISPSDGQTKEWQEERLLELVKEHKIDLVVLARYMQILSPKLCQAMEGRIINSSSS
jgi:formyltetrahydrofolate hydrolase